MIDLSASNRGILTQSFLVTMDSYEFFGLIFDRASIWGRRCGFDRFALLGCRERITHIVGGAGNIVLIKGRLIVNSPLVDKLSFGIDDEHMRGGLGPV